MEKTQDKKNDIMTETFCPLPFIHFNAYPDKQIKPCCYSQSFFENTTLKNQDIVTAFNSEEYQKLRNDLLNGVEHKFCDVCWKTEKNGGESQRIKWSKFYEDKKEDIIERTQEDGYYQPDFVSLDLRPSNICNFKCRTCTPDFSTTWIDERTKFREIMGDDVIDYKTQVTSFDIPQENINNLEKIYFAGGEPLYMDDMYKFIDKIKNKEKVELYFNTNFSIIKHKNKSVFDLFKDFKKVHIGISCDGYGPIGEYVRTNFKWETFKENVYKLGNAINNGANFSYGFQYTSSILNCFHFFDFRDMLYDIKFISNDVQLQFGVAEYPFWLNPAHFDLKDEVITYFEGKIDMIQNDSLRTELNNYIIYLKTFNDPHIYALNYLKNFIKLGDETNNTVLPEELTYLKKYLI